MVNNLICLIFFKVWKLWNEEDIVSLIDSEIYNSNNMDQILRCIHIGLLCVQELAKERPTMAKVISMLNNEIDKFPQPCQPAFIDRRIEDIGESSQNIRLLTSMNDVTITSLHGR